MKASALFSSLMLAFLLAPASTSVAGPAGIGCTPSGGDLTSSATGVTATGTGTASLAWCRVVVIVQWQTGASVFPGCEGSNDDKSGITPPFADTVTATCTDEPPTGNPGATCAVASEYTYEWSPIESEWTFSGGAALPHAGELCFNSEGKPFFGDYVQHLELCLPQPLGDPCPPPLPRLT